MKLEENTSYLSGVVWSIDCLVLGDQILWLGRLWVWLSGSCFGSEDILWGGLVEWLKGRAQTVAMTLPFEVEPLTVHFLGAMVDLEESFWGRFFGGEILNVNTQILMKVPVCGGDFSLRIIKRSIHITSESMSLVYKLSIINTTQKIDGDKIFLCENSIWEKSRGGERFTIIL